MRLATISSMYGENLSILKKPFKQNTPLFLAIKTNTRQYTTKLLDSLNNQSNDKYKENKIALELPLHLNFLTLEVHAGSNSSKKLVGTATVPVSDMVGQLPGDHVQFLSYRLRDVKGDKNGIINFCVEMKAAWSSAPAGHDGGGCGCAVSRKEWGVPAGETKVAGGVVAGVPIWYHMHQVKC